MAEDLAAIEKIMKMRKIAVVGSIVTAALLVVAFFLPYAAGTQDYR